MELQEDALIEILARLPVKSLIRCKIVCKYWLDLISSPEFATKHYATRLSQNQHENDSVLILYPPACSISILSYKNLAFETAFKLRPAIDYEPARFNIYHRDVIYEFRIYGPCNGLFLVRFEKHEIGCIMFMWNPATREIFRLPGTDDFVFNQVGIGFDSITNDYKVVLFDVRSSGRVLLYSLAANSWRYFDTGFGFWRGYLDCNTSSSSNGRMHNWIYSEPTDVFFCHNYSLISFDMVDEVFVLTPMPYKSKNCDEFLDQGSNHMYPTVFYLEDVIEGTQVMEIWVLKEYGPTGYWSKQQSITISHTQWMINLLFWKNRAILSPSLDGEKAIFMYDLTTQEVKPLHIQIPGYNTISYTESLISMSKIVSPPPDHLPVQNAPTPSHDHLLHGYYQEDSSVEFPLLQQQQQQQYDVHHEEDSSVENVFQQLQLETEVTPEIDEDSDDSSTDSAFQVPRGKGFLEYSDGERTDLSLYRLRKSFRKKEWEKLIKLPYCLHEVNQPISSNPCIF